MDTFREFFERAHIGTVFLTTLEGLEWVGTKGGPNEIVWLQNHDRRCNTDNPIFSTTGETFWASYKSYGSYNVLIDYIEPDEKGNTGGLCTCDFYSVVLVTGCKCGGK